MRSARGRRPDLRPSRGWEGLTACPGPGPLAVVDSWHLAEKSCGISCASLRLLRRHSRTLQIRRWTLTGDEPCRCAFPPEVSAATACHCVKALLRLVLGLTRGPAGLRTLARQWPEHVCSSSGCCQCCTVLLPYALRHSYRIPQSHNLCKALAQTAAWDWECKACWEHSGAPAMFHFDVMNSLSATARLKTIKDHL